MATKVHLVVIDPQVDFCDPQKGTLYVKGAEKDMARLAQFVREKWKKLSDIHVTLDSHHIFDVAHPCFWVGKDGKNPAPFTIIAAADIETGRWTPARPSLSKRMLDYARGLEKGGRYPLCIWPPHCLIGTPGASVAPELMEALNVWATKKLATVDFVAKGSNPLTEHYSAIQAEVPDPSDPKTMVNASFVKTLMDADQVAVAGEAGSHCLANTVRDVANQFGDDSLVAKIVLLEDATSSVPGFEKYYDDFRAEMTRRGMKISTTRDYLA
jgi:nicotinamidase-related amidase